MVKNYLRHLAQFQVMVGKALVPSRCYDRFNDACGTHTENFCKEDSRFYSVNKSKNTHYVASFYSLVSCSRSSSRWTSQIFNKMSMLRSDCEFDGKRSFTLR